MKILIVDDIAVNRQLLEAIMRYNNYEFASAVNGIEALTRLRADSFDAIISDILMPKMDGFRLIRECKKDPALKKIPFIFYTATYTEKQDAEFGLSLGAERYLIKPMDPVEFLRTLKEILETVSTKPVAQCTPAMESEESYLKEYSHRIGQKLEKKVQTLEETEGELRAFQRDLDEVTEVVHEIDGELNRRVKARTETLEQEIEEQKKAQVSLTLSLKEKEVLLREIHHRVKNNLQIITSLIRLQKNKITDVTTNNAMIDVESRIRSMALVHEKLYNSADLKSIPIGDYLRTLSTQLIHLYSLDQSRIRFRIEMEDIAIDINQTIPIGLLMNELITNALKHAFPGGRDGEISIAGEIRDADLVITFKDNGIGIPTDFDWRNAKTLGLRLVVTLTDQINGTVELVRDGGTIFIIRIPFEQTDHKPLEMNTGTSS
ncbi:MAG: histidine kinase dimerization/phosphoacceptor domain -containing protein [Methanoregula sp.]|nr:histidine kinase dimerization/phosphoacceptor domain -containing protein [Methanoregula sp.]